MSSRTFLLLALPFALSACHIVNPEYVRDPDRELDALLRQLLAEREPHDGKREQLVGRVYTQAARHPSHVPTLVAAGTLALEDGYSARAEQFFGRVIRLDPAHAEARMLRARIAVDDGNLGLASDLIEEGIAYRPDESRLHEAAAWVFYLSENFELAHEALDRASRLDAPMWRVYFNRGLIEERRGNHQAALMHYRDCLSNRPGYEPAEMRRAGLAAIQ